MFTDKSSLEPSDRVFDLLDAAKISGQKRSNGVHRQMENGFSLSKRPFRKLLAQASQIAGGKEICELGHVVRHATENLVAPNAGQHNAASLVGQIGGKVISKCGIASGTWNGGERVAVINPG